MTKTCVGPRWPASPRHAAERPGNLHSRPQEQKVGTARPDLHTSPPIQGNNPSCFRPTHCQRGLCFGLSGRDSLQTQMSPGFRKPRRSAGYTHPSVHIVAAPKGVREATELHVATPIHCYEGLSTGKPSTLEQPNRLPLPECGPVALLAMWGAGTSVKLRNECCPDRQGPSRSVDPQSSSRYGARGRFFGSRSLKVFRSVAPPTLCQT